MPSVSIAQKKAASIALAAKRGKIHPSKLQGASREMYDSMADSDLKDFAGTDSSRLPYKVEERLREYIRKTIQEVLSEVELNKDDRWIQKAVNPSHKGDCTPMTKKTCTPKRKALAKRFKGGIEKEVVEDEISGGKGDNLDPNSVDQNELAIGIEVEREHTDSTEQAEEISLDHLSENPKYYSELLAAGLVDEKPAKEKAKELKLTEDKKIRVIKARYSKDVGPGRNNGKDFGYRQFNSLGMEIGYGEWFATSTERDNYLKKKNFEIIEAFLKSGNSINDDLSENINEYAGINVLPANGQITMGTKGDASFFGPDAKIKGGVRKSVYKVPKSSIHNDDDDREEDDNVTPAFYDDKEKRAGKKSHVHIGNIPKTSIHNKKFNETAGFPATSPGGSVGDASFIGKNGMYKGNSRKPVFKTPKSSIYYKKGRFPGEADFHNDNNWETDKPGPSTDVSGKKTFVGNKSVPKNSIHYDEIPDEDRHYISTQEQLGMPVSADGSIDGGPRSMDPVVGKKTKKKKFADASKYGYPKEAIEEKKDYNTNIVPKTSIHYGERDKVKGQPKMKFEKRITKEAGFVPDEIKNLKTQGNWKSNLTKAVMDLTGEAQPQETSIPVPQVPIGDTPEFPYANEESGEMVYPIPGMGMAIKKGNEWTFGDTPELPSVSQGEETSGCALGHGEPSNGEIDIPCSKKPMIKKLMMLIKKERSNLHEGIVLKGLYEGKVVKLNTIFEGEHRRFKTFVKTNEGKVVKVHFGPKRNEECAYMKNKKVSESLINELGLPEYKNKKVLIYRSEQWEYTAYIEGMDISGTGSSEVSAERNLLRKIVFGTVDIDVIKK